MEGFAGGVALLAWWRGFALCWHVLALLEK
jgi:hypothetical protein